MTVKPYPLYWKKSWLPPTLSHYSEEMKYQRFAILFASTLILGNLSIGNAALNLELPDMNVPDLGDPASNTLSSTHETLLGLQLLREVRGSKPVIEDPELIGWLRALGQRLASHAPAGMPFYFLLSKDPSINAYAMPGGVIVIHAGLILNTQSESELAAVIAHEIAHVTQRHIARLMAEQNPNPLVTGLGVLAGAAAAKHSADAAQAIVTGTLAMQAHRQRVFSQQMETEADRVGLRILASSSMDPQAMPTFLEKLDRRTQDLYGDLTQYLRTHPLTLDRISDTRSRARQVGHVTIREDSDYRYAREKLRAMISPGSATLTDNDSQLARYAQAAQQLRNGKAAVALQTLGTQTHHLPTALLMAQALNATRRYPETIRLLTPLAAAYPGQDSILAPLAEALLADQQVDKAWQLLEHLPLQEQTSLESLEIRQRAAEAAGQTVEAYHSAAERSVRMGEYAHAKAALEQASRLPGTSATTVARLNALAQAIAQMEARAKSLEDQ